MLITELAHTNQKVLAKELRKLIEPDKAKSNKVLKESEIRKFLCTKNLTYYGISDIISVLKTNYTDKTISRLLTKINYLIHTDAIKNYLIPIELTDEQKSFIYAS